jgi:hypothetical protein
VNLGPRMLYTSIASTFHGLVTEPAALTGFQEPLVGLRFPESHCPAASTRPVLEADWLLHSALCPLDRRGQATRGQEVTRERGATYIDRLEAAESQGEEGMRTAQARFSRESNRERSEH